MAYGNDEQHGCHPAGCHAGKDAPKEIPLGCAPKEVPLGCAVSYFDISESQY